MARDSIKFDFQNDKITTIADDASTVDYTSEDWAAYSAANPDRTTEDWIYMGWDPPA